jgi:quercetin dioxygenase-like cupin family protein
MRDFTRKTKEMKRYLTGFSTVLVLGALLLRTPAAVVESPGRESVSPVAPARAAAVTPPASLPLGATEARRSAAKMLMTRDVLPGEIPGIRSTLVSLSAGVTHGEPASTDEDRVFLVLAGNGKLAADGAEYLVVRETIAHFPVGRSVEVKASSEQGIDLLIVRLTLTPVDREDLAAHTNLNQVAYVKNFKECEPYTEAIKSAKTVSRTLLPKDIVPRMAMGTVETTGPDSVAPHRHPMLEQYFLGLEDNDITVMHDEARTPLKANELFHIPSGSNHGAEVADGHKLYYLWMDFFQDRKGLEWLNEHKPITPTK